MGWVDELKGHIVGLDTAPLIHYTEKSKLYFDVVKPFFRRIGHNDFTVVTSIVSLLEVLVIPKRRSDIKLAQTYRDILLDTEGLETVYLKQEIAEEAARLRAFHKIRTPDSIQMATAIKMNATYFLTNDLRLPSLPELKIITLDELKTRPEYLAPDDLH